MRGRVKSRNVVKSISEEHRKKTGARGHPRSVCSTACPHTREAPGKSSRGNGTRLHTSRDAVVPLLLLKIFVPVHGLSCKLIHRVSNCTNQHGIPHPTLENDVQHMIVQATFADVRCRGNGCACCCGPPGESRGMSCSQWASQQYRACC
jgi:hypothetical protein